MRPDDMGNMDDMNSGEYYTAQQPNTASMSQSVPWEDNQNVPYEFGTPRERTAQPDNAAWTPFEPVEVLLNPEFANGPQVADDDEACDMALTPTASEFDVQTPACEFDDLARSPERAETPPADTPMRQFEASLPMRDPAEVAARVNFFQDSIQEEVDTDVQTPVPTPGTERARLNPEFPTYPDQECQMLDEDVMRAAPDTPGTDILNPGQEQTYSAATPGWTWEETATPDAMKQAPLSPCDSLTFDREAFSAALQDAIAEGTGMAMAENNTSPSLFH